MLFSQDYEVMVSEEATAANLSLAAEVEATLEASGENSLPTLLAADEELAVPAAAAAAYGRFSVHQTWKGGAEESNLFPSVASVLRIWLGNLTTEDLLELQFANLSCVADENIVGPSVFASTRFTIRCKYILNNFLKTSLKGKGHEIRIG